MTTNFIDNFNFDSIGVLSRVFSILLVIICVLLVRKLIFTLIRKALRKIEDEDPDLNAKEQRAYTLADIAKSVVGVILYLVAGMIILSELGVNITPILTGAGILGLAVGFGTQTLVKDMVTGFFLLLEGQFNKGDYVEIGGVKGVVKEMKLRTTIIKGEGGEINIIPNSQITKVTRFPKETKPKR